MANIHKSITELVGNTPLVEFERLEKALGLKGRIVGKLEYFNPAGSHKDRIALEIIEDAEKRGDISPDKTTLVEFTSGNTGVALAAFAAAKGYKFKISVQPGVSIERSKLLEAYHAEIVPVDPAKFAELPVKGLAVLDEIQEEQLANTPNGYATRQLDNPDNVKAHYKHTGPEIWRDTDGKVDEFIAGVGTGGSSHGVSQYLKEQNEEVKTIVVQPDPESVVNSAVEGATDGGFHGIHQIYDEQQGYLNTRPGNFSDEYIDEFQFVTYAETLKAIHLLGQYEGVFVGASSGAALALAIREAKKPENEGKLIVALLPDNGERYLSEDLQRVRPELEDEVNFEPVYSKVAE